LVKLFELRLSVVAGIQSAELHATSKNVKLVYRLAANQIILQEERGIRLHYHSIDSREGAG
ncbi:MAG: hypothetical protein ACREPG_09715, partial [Candidatus Binatia bacterium]